MGIFDLILKGGHVIDLAQNLDAISDVAVINGDTGSCGITKPPR